MPDHYNTSFWAKKVAGVQSDPLAISSAPPVVPPSVPPTQNLRGLPKSYQRFEEPKKHSLTDRAAAAIMLTGEIPRHVVETVVEPWKQLPEKMEEAKKGKYDIEYWAGRVLDTMIGGAPGSQGGGVAASGPRSPFPKGEIVESLVGTATRKGPWYSFLYKTLSEGRVGKFDLGANPKAKSLLSMLRKVGVNEDELVGTGLTELLTNLGQERITLESVKDFVRKHPMQTPKVTMLGGPVKPELPKIRDIETMSTSELRVFMSDINQDVYEISSKAANALLEVLENREHNPKFSVKNSISMTPEVLYELNTLPKSTGYGLESHYSPSTYPAFNLPGEVGAYREVLYHYPSKTGGSFESPHFENYGKDLMAHSRGHLRTLPNGKKAMHIDEAQSDLHQRGSVEGYSNIRDLRQQLSESRARRDMVEAERLKYVTSDSYSISKPDYKQAQQLDEIMARLKRAQIEVDSLTKKVEGRNVVPETPYKTSWHKLVIRDWMQRAIDEGAEGVSWTSAAQQAKRYNKLANKMEWSRAIDGSYEITFTSPNGRTQGVYTTAQKIESDTSRNVARIIKDQEATGAKTGLAEGEFLVKSQLYEKVYDKDFVKFFKSEYGLEAKKIPGGKAEGLSSKYDIIPVDELTRKDLKVDYAGVNAYVDTFQRRFDEVAIGAREGTIKAVEYTANEGAWNIRNTMTNKNIGGGFGKTAEEAIADRQKSILRDLNDWLLRRTEAEKRLKSDYFLVRKGETSPGQHEILSQVPFGKTREEVIKNAEQRYGVGWTQDLGELWYVPLPESLKTKIRLEGQRISQNALQSLKQAYA